MMYKLFCDFQAISPALKSDARNRPVLAEAINILQVTAAEERIYGFLQSPNVGWCVSY